MIVRRMLAGLVTTVVVAGLLAPAPAHAQAQDALGAYLSGSADQIRVHSIPSDPNVTCDVKAGGRDLVQHTNYVFGEVYGQDFGTAEGECASLDSTRMYTVTLTVEIEYYTAIDLFTGYWSPVGCSATSSAVSRKGIAVPIPPVATCVYPGTSPYLNAYHRAHAILTPSIPGSAPREDYSPIWFMAP